MLRSFSSVVRAVPVAFARYPSYIPVALPLSRSSFSTSSANPFVTTPVTASVEFLLTPSDSRIVSSVVSEQPSVGKCVCQAVARRKHTMLLDEKGQYGGGDIAPSPYDHILAALGGCTLMTVRIYAERHKLEVPPLQLQLCHSKRSAADVREASAEIKGLVDLFELTFSSDTSVTPQQQLELLAIAARCPVHRTLGGNPRTFIRTRWAPPKDA